MGRQSIITSKQVGYFSVHQHPYDLLNKWGIVEMLLPGSTQLILICGKKVPAPYYVHGWWLHLVSSVLGYAYDLISCWYAHSHALLNRRDKGTKRPRLLFTLREPGLKWRNHWKCFIGTIISLPQLVTYGKNVIRKCTTYTIITTQCTTSS